MIEVKQLDFKIILSKPLKTSFNQVMEVIDMMDVQLEDTDFDGAGYSSSVQLYDSQGKKTFGDEIELKIITINYTFGKEVEIDKSLLLDLCSDILVQREETDLDVELSSVEITVKDSNDQEVLEHSLV